MEATPDIKLFGKWSFDDVEVRLRPMHCMLHGRPRTRPGLTWCIQHAPIGQ